MLEFSEIKQQYPEKLQQYERAILREYLQYKILQAIFQSQHASKLSFIGGTALRIIHGNNRFSEDIDLDNFGLSWEEFEQVVEKVQRFMTLEGFLVEIRNIEKGAYHCYLRFPDLLFSHGLSPIQQEKILIQVDTTAQGYQYNPETVLLNRFDVFTDIKVSPLSILLSQKIYASVNRKRPKGRDFYDITYLASRTKPDMGYLHQKLNIRTHEQLKTEIAAKIANYDFASIAKDVAPFLINTNDIRRVERFREFWSQADFK